MLRGIRSITATVAAVCALTGCSSGATPEISASTTQAATAQCSHGGQGAETVALVSFDEVSLRLTGLTPRGSLVVGRLTPDTVEVAANLRAFPPDPIFPACSDDAATYNQVVGSGLTPSLGALQALAADGCNASIGLASNGTVTSFQPVP
jgi:hypothetical protein